MDVVVPGVLPIGCFPLYLTLYPSSNKDDYDEIGCLKSFNNLSSYHNDLLKQAVSGLQSKHAGVRLMYADFYAQVADMVRSPESFGTCAPPSPRRILSDMSPSLSPSFSIVCVKV